MITTLGSERARTLLPELWDAAHRGQSFVITKRGRPYAALFPIAQLPRISSHFLALKGSGVELWGDDCAAEVHRLRGEWE